MDKDIEDVAKQLAAHGIELTIEGSHAQLTIDGRQLERPWRRETDYGPRPSSPSERTFVIGERLAPRVVANIRARGDWYADARGNVYVSAPGVRVDIRGQRPVEARGVRTATKSTNLLSTRRAQVIFCMLSWPALVQVSVRGLAEAAGVSPAVAHTTRRALEREGYLHPGATSIDRYDELLDRWATAFPLGLARDLTLGVFAGQPDPRAGTDAGIPFYLSGESAAPNLRETSLTMYVREIEPRALAASRWRRPRDGEEPSITIRRKFWTDPMESASDSTRPASLAPPILVYADLLASRDARQREIALALRETLRDSRQG